MRPTEDDSRDGYRLVPYEQRPRVLLADDDVDLREVIAEALREEGFEVLEAATGTELFRMVAPASLGNQRRPAAELVVSDLRMPGVTGMTVLDGLRERDWRMPFILMTAFGDAETHQEARRLGAAAVLDKPFEMRGLIRLVRECLSAS